MDIGVDSGALLIHIFIVVYLIYSFVKDKE
jgi:hypothetical protein